MEVIAIAIAVLAVVGLLFALHSLRDMRQRYGGIIDVERERDRVAAEKEALAAEAEEYRKTLALRKAQETATSDPEVETVVATLREQEVTPEREILDKLDRWANDLVAPALPLRATREGLDGARLEFRQQIPESVMVGKLVRAVSGLRGALVLAEAGHITECATVLRIVSDFCTEISAIGASLHRGGKLPLAVKDFVDQYFMPRARTPDEFAATERKRYVSREKLMRAHEALAGNQPIDMNLLKRSHRYLNMIYDSYVHGAFETTMDLWNPRTCSFEMRGHPSPQKQEEFVEAVFQKMHEVVVVLEMTAATTAHSEVFKQVRETRRSMDATNPWKHSGAEGSA